MKGSGSFHPSEVLFFKWMHRTELNTAHDFARSYVDSGSEDTPVLKRVTAASAASMKARQWTDTRRTGRGQAPSCGRVGTSLHCLCSCRFTSLRRLVLTDSPD